MPGADGYITYSTKLDNKELEKDLTRTTRDIEKLEKQLLKNGDKRLPISRRVSELGGQLDEAKVKLAALQDEAQRVTAAMSGANANDPASVKAYADAAARQAGVTRELTAQQKLVDGLHCPFSLPCITAPVPQTAQRQIPPAQRDADRQCLRLRR